MRVKIQNEKEKVEKSSISNDTTKAQDTLNVLEHMAQMSIESQELKKVLIWMKIISSKLKV